MYPKGERAREGEKERGRGQERERRREGEKERGRGQERERRRGGEGKRVREGNMSQDVLMKSRCS